MTPQLILLAACSAALSGQTKPLPPGKVLIDRHIEACGGLKALGSVKSLVIRGRLTISEAGISGKVTQYQSEDGEHYFVLELQGAGKIESGNNGDVEWERSTLMGPKITRVADRPGGLLHPDPMMARQWQGNYSAETVGTETVDGKPCYRVEVTQ